jgi:hypothetical protein
MNKLVFCTKAQFDEFLANYPRQLEHDVLAICQPERVQYNDFTLGSWPRSVVAEFSAWGCTPDNIYGPNPGDWRVLRAEDV